MVIVLRSYIGILLLLILPNCAQVSDYNYKAELHMHSKLVETEIHKKLVRDAVLAKKNSNFSKAGHKIEKGDGSIFFIKFIRKDRFHKEKEISLSIYFNGDYRKHKTIFLNNRSVICFVSIENGMFGHCKGGSIEITKSGESEYLSFVVYGKYYNVYSNSSPFLSDFQFFKNHILF